MASGEGQVDQSAADSLLVMLVHFGMEERTRTTTGKSNDFCSITKIRNSPTN